MKKKGSKKEYSKDELKRYVGAVLEEVKDGFKASQEQTLSINQRLDSIEGEVKNIRMDVMELKSKLNQVNLYVMTGFSDKVDKKHFVDLESRVRKLEKN